MNALLIDTNTYTHAMRGDADVVAVLQKAARIAISSITIGELLSGFRGGNREQQNRDELAEFLDAPRVELRAVTENTAEFYADILHRLRVAGTPIPTNDIWIAAIAFEHGMRLYTKDHHFQRVPGLVLVS